jgi:hypothetical protein
MLPLARGYIETYFLRYIMEQGKKTAKIRVQAIKITREKQRVIKQSGVTVTAAVKAELMKLAIAEAPKEHEKYPNG